MPLSTQMKPSLSVLLSRLVSSLVMSVMSSSSMSPTLPRYRDTGGVMTRMIERNTTIPSSKSVVYPTAQDNQPVSKFTSSRVNVRWHRITNLSVDLFSKVSSLLLVASHRLKLLLISMPLVFSVSAKDKGTGKNRKSPSKIVAVWAKKKSKISSKKQKQIVTRIKRKELVEARNMADSHIHQGEKPLKENADPIKEEDKKLVEEKIEGWKKSSKTLRQQSHKSKKLQTLSMKHLWKSDKLSTLLAHHQMTA